VKVGGRSETVEEVGLSRYGSFMVRSGHSLMFCTDFHSRFIHKWTNKSYGNVYIKFITK